MASPSSNTVSTDCYRNVYRQFCWHAPAAFNIAEVCCERRAENPVRIALNAATTDRDGYRTHGALPDRSNRHAHAGSVPTERAGISATR